MQIKYTKDRLRFSLVLGRVNLICGVLLLLLSAWVGEIGGIDLLPVGVGMSAGGATLIAYYFLEKRRQYLRVENGIVTKQTFPPEKVNLAEVSAIRTFAGKLKLVTSKGEFVIDTKVIEPGSLTALQSELRSLNVPWN